MASFQGFVRGTRYTPSPNDLFGTLLQEIDTLAELKCTLRVLALVYQRRAGRPFVSLQELLGDPVLQVALSREEGGAQEAVRRGVAGAVARGTLLEFRPQGGDGAPLVLVNDEQGRRALQQMPRLLGSGPATSLASATAPEPIGASPTPEGPKANIYVLYEENVGPLTPLLAEELKEAEAAYPGSWVQEAFQEAVACNRRSWRYIARILERWAAEGKGHGEPGRHTQADSLEEHRRRYGRLSRS